MYLLSVPRSALGLMVCSPRLTDHPSLPVGLYAHPHRIAKKWGASPWGIFGAFLGLVIGVFVGGIIGMIVMPILGTIIFELLTNKEVKESFKAGMGVFVGFVMGVMVKLVVAVAILGWFIFQVASSK